MALPPAPWDVVLGRTADGQIIVVPGPQGPQGLPGGAGPAGANGATGPIAAPLAKYLLDTTDAGLVNGIVIHRALGPDRVPAVPNAMDDEMVTVGTGYNPTKWTPFNVGLSTYNLDPVGGLRIDVTDSDAVIHPVEQDLPGAGPWAFTMKVANGAPFIGAANNKEFIGISVRNTSNGRFDLLYLARYSQANKVIRSKYDAGSNDISDTFTTWADPTAYYYLRIVGTASNLSFQVSTNGLTFVEVESSALYAAVVNKIGFFTLCNEAVPWSAYVQWFRRTA